MAHRHGAVVLQQPQDVHVAEAHVALDQPAHRGAAQLADPTADFCQDGLDRCRTGRFGGSGFNVLPADTSHYLKHSSGMNDFVNQKDCEQLVNEPMNEEAACASR